MTAALAQASKQQWADPARRELQSERFKQQLKQLWADPAYRELLSKRAKQQWTDPVYRELRRKAMADPAYREMTSKRFKQLWANPAYRELQSKRASQWCIGHYSERVAHNRKISHDPVVIAKIKKSMRKAWSARRVSYEAAKLILGDDFEEAMKPAGNHRLKRLAFAHRAFAGAFEIMSPGEPMPDLSKPEKGKGK